jgi:hypothetical protein
MRFPRKYTGDDYASGSSFTNTFPPSHGWLGLLIYQGRKWGCPSSPLHKDTLTSGFFLCRWCGILPPSNNEGHLYYHGYSLSFLGKRWDCATMCKVVYFLSGAMRTDKGYNKNSLVTCWSSHVDIWGYLFLWKNLPEIRFGLLLTELLINFRGGRLICCVSLIKKLWCNLYLQACSFT